MKSFILNINDATHTSQKAKIDYQTSMTHYPLPMTKENALNRKYANLLSIIQQKYPQR